MIPHDFEIAALAQNWLDDLADRVGSDLLEAIWRTKFSIFLRYRECVDRNWPVVGESADLFVGRVRIITVSVAVRHRSRRCVADGTSVHRRNRVHVRFASAAVRSAAQFVSCRDSAAVAVGNLAIWLRLSRMEMANAHDVD